MTRAVCIHGHFYQPPRENAWLEEVEVQDSAYPYHDWNERINAEAYAPNTASRLLEPGGKIKAIVNNYSRISFNFGPTLLSWMQIHAPDTYRAVLEADKESLQRFGGHGSAIAQVYNHMIMPLANSRDKRTQVIWGIVDFEQRFGRKPEGMWLPETAVDLESLDQMAERGIRFSILKPNQASRVRKIGEDHWTDVSGSRIDPKMPYLCHLPSGRTIALFFYDFPVAADVAFQKLPANGELFAKRLIGLFGPQGGPQLAHVATDGETYGHHQQYADMGLAFCLNYIETNRLAELTVYGQFLERHPPTHEVEIFERTSWSCAHGVERWRSNCGDNAGHPGWQQEWRRPLREAMDWLRDQMLPLFERDLAPLVHDPWRARDDYIYVILDRSKENVEQFLSDHARRPLNDSEKIAVLKMLGIQRMAMLMFTSCGWFFDEISGIETYQVLQYAARAMQMAREVGWGDFEPGYLRILANAKSNIPEFGHGERVYDMLVRPAIIDLERVAGHFAMISLFEKAGSLSAIYSYRAETTRYDRYDAGRRKLALGTVRLTSQLTWDSQEFTLAVLHLGDHNLISGVRAGGSKEQCCDAIREAFEKNDVPEAIRVLDRDFAEHRYNLRHLFRDEQRKVIANILYPTIRDLESVSRETFRDHAPMIWFMHEVHVPLPAGLACHANFVANREFYRLLDPATTMDTGKLRRLIECIRRTPLELNASKIGVLASEKIGLLMLQLAGTPTDLALLKNVDEAIVLLQGLSSDVSLWKPQNTYFSIAQGPRAEMHEKAGAGDQQAKAWIETFDQLGSHLGVKIT